MRTDARVVLAALTALLITAPAFAFHDGGVAQCEGCHTMHNSLGGTQTTTFLPQYQSGPFLLKAEDQSGACLNCHQGATDTGPSNFHVSTIDTAVDTTAVTKDGFPRQRGPGGDFRWLKVMGDRAGHNIIAKNFNYSMDATSGYTVAPGGAYPVANLHCSSCHDPHGKYRLLSDGTVATTGAPIIGSTSYTNVAPTAGEALGVYRLLGGKNYLPKSLVSNPAAAFAKDEVPMAVAPSIYNATEATTQVIVAYGKNMSEWCANCHNAIHTNMQPGDYLAGTANLAHPAGNSAKLSFIADSYNAYKSSGVMTGGTYSSLVPFEQGKSQFDATLVAGTAPTASATDSNVACISCHRVHASGYESMLRFDINTFTTGDAGTIKYSTVATTNAKQQAALYDREPVQFGVAARTLCNKCHAKD